MSRKNNPNWSSWFEKAQKGNKGAYQQLLLEIYPVLRKFIGKYFNDPKKAEDVIQDTLLKIHVSRHTYQPGKPFEPWMFAVARSAVNNRLRGHYLYQARFAASLENVQEPGAPADQHLSTDAERALCLLSPNYQRALELVKIEGLTMQQAAKKMDMSEGAFKVLAHRAYKKFKEALEDERKSS